MAERLAGKAAADHLYHKTRERAETFSKENGFSPCLAIVRVGSKPEDLAYERGVRRHAEDAGVALTTRELPEDVTEDGVIDVIHELNSDERVTGILLFLPLPQGMNQKKVVEEIAPDKDVDGATDASRLFTYTGAGAGFAPCTPEAVLVICDEYGISLEGKHVVVIGRSLVVGKPLSMLLLKRNATVTVCHSRTRNLASITKSADILVSAAGRIGMVTGNMVRPGQTVIDVGINFDQDGKMKGDVLFDDVSEIVDAVTPVPGGVGAVTTAVLLSHAVPAV
ncbi:MAG: bifunctional 5,10-methylenetetrahydrofolate dehydrogenase/5,10-methenyltetrahydrofolate cyclohydrolase [Lachnospiraceae bacterium]|nr:bifunctional 5,10-methylenetetrahydrofolate dehydrogenase/5,10-methenyltetrahydrofolate cyclohydrolase [Lachnospiraceae bacterium]